LIRYRALCGIWKSPHGRYSSGAMIRPVIHFDTLRKSPETFGLRCMSLCYYSQPKNTFSYLKIIYCEIITKYMCHMLHVSSPDCRAE
jgi:hypothetical protein